MAVLVAVTAKPGATRGAFGTPPQEETRDRPSSSWRGGGIPPIPKVPIGLPFRASVSASHGLTPKQTPLFLIAPPLPRSSSFSRRDAICHSAMYTTSHQRRSYSYSPPPAEGGLFVCPPSVTRRSSEGSEGRSPSPFSVVEKRMGSRGAFPPFQRRLSFSSSFSLSLSHRKPPSPPFLPRPPLALGPPCRREGLFLPSGTLSVPLEAIKEKGAPLSQLLFIPYLSPTKPSGISGFQERLFGLVSAAAVRDDRGFSALWGLSGRNVCGGNRKRGRRLLIERRKKHKWDDLCHSYLAGSGFLVQKAIFCLSLVHHAICPQLCLHQFTTSG